MRKNRREELELGKQSAHSDKTLHSSENRIGKAGKVWCLY